MFSFLYVYLKLVYLNVGQLTEQSNFMCDRVPYVFKDYLKKINKTNKCAYGCHCETKYLLSKLKNMNQHDPSHS